MQKENFWYISEDISKNLRQVVLIVSEKNWKPSRFRTLILLTKYAPLITSDWATGLFYMPDKTGPFLMIRVDGLVKQIKKTDLHFGFSFFYMKHGGLFVIFVESFPRVTGSPHNFLEIVYGLDIKDNRQHIEDMFRKNNLEIILTDRSNKPYVFLDSAAMSYAPRACFDLQVPLPRSLKRTLLQEWELLQIFHESLAKNIKNHHLAAQEMWKLIPLNKSPLLPA